jgi:hypothetical protein
MTQSYDSRNTVSLGFNSSLNLEFSTFTNEIIRTIQRCQWLNGLINDLSLVVSESFLTDIFSSPCCPRELKRVQVIVGDGGIKHPDKLYLRSPIEDLETLEYFRTASTTRAVDDVEFHFYLPALEARVFGLVVKHMNGEELGNVDNGGYNPETHISTWCVLYSLAVRFRLPQLMEDSICSYQKSRGPHWQGCWLPLPSEIKYLYEAGLPNGKLDFLTDYLVGIFSAASLSTSLDNLNSLLSHDKFRLDYLRAQRVHMSIPSISPDCPMEDCQIHSPWMRLDTRYAKTPP